MPEIGPFLPLLLLVFDEVHDCTEHDLCTQSDRKSINSWRNCRDCDWLTLKRFSHFQWVEDGIIKLQLLLKYIIALAPNRAYCVYYILDSLFYQFPAITLFLTLSTTVCTCWLRDTFSNFDRCMLPGEELRFFNKACSSCLLYCSRNNSTISQILVCRVDNHLYCFVRNVSLNYLNLEEVIDFGGVLANLLPFQCFYCFLHNLLIYY